MSTFTTRCRIFALMACVVVANAVTMEPAPATILTTERPIENASVESETTDGVVFYLGDWKAPTRVAVTRKPGQYLKVNYIGNSDTSFMRAEVLYNTGKFDEAPEHYKKAIATGKWNWEVEQAYRRAADSLARTGKGPDALALLKEYIGRFPKNVHMAEVVALRAKLALAAGDFPGAMADFQLMTKEGAKWSPTAELEGYLGQRSVLVAQKKFADFVVLLNFYWAKLKADIDSEVFAQVALAIANDLDADGKPAECIVTLKKTYLAPLANEAQASARLHHAQILAKANDTENNLAAFDQAAIAVLLGGDEATQPVASKLAHELANRIEKDMKLSNEVHAQYRSYSSSL
ncbi:MAG TPA: tetratricopeptide repeat protein [Rhizobacter sp.]|nr:tetratricopeptide repeat protein [Rhizobacter sp.]